MKDRILRKNEQNWPGAHFFTGPLFPLCKLRHGTEPPGSPTGDCLVHGTGNLCVAGNSLIPAGGCANPTFTIVALAARLGRELAPPHA